MFLCIYLEKKQMKGIIDKIFYDCAIRLCCLLPYQLWNVNLVRVQVFQDDEAYRYNDFILTLSILMLIHVGGRAMRYKHFSIRRTMCFDIQRSIMDSSNVWFRTFDTRYRLFDFYCTRKTCSIHRMPWR